MACLDFVNSEWRDHRTGRIEDRLLQPKWLEQFLARWKLLIADSPTPSVLAALTSLRSLLQHIIETLSHGQFPVDEDVETLNKYLNSTSLKRHLERIQEEYRLELVPMKKDWDWVQAEIAASFADLLALHDPYRVKMCENANCRWVFYDESRNHSRRWCEDNSCGNMMKVRRFRARHQDS